MNTVTLTCPTLAEAKGLALDFIQASGILPKSIAAQTRGGRPCITITWSSTNAPE